MPTDYQSNGKQEFRDLLFALARQSDVRTYGTFWGTGIDSRQFAEAGFDVVAAEIVQAKHERAAMDADMHGYRVHRGRAGKLTTRFGMFHADFDGGPSPMNFREVRRIAAITDQWLAVTLSMDHQRDESMMGEAAFYTVPAWLTGAAGFTLEYLSRYRRNRFGQTMWVAILQRREGKGNSHRVQPIQIARAIPSRGYWASRQMYQRRLLPHTNAPETPVERERSAAYYQEHRDRYRSIARQSYERRKEDPVKVAADRDRSATWQKSEAGRAWMAAWAAARRRTDPEWAERRRQYKRDWYARKKALAVQSTASEALQKAA